MEWRHLKVNGDLGIVMPRNYSPKDRDSMRRCIEGSDIVINLCGKVRAACSVCAHPLPAASPLHTHTRTRTTPPSSGL